MIIAFLLIVYQHVECICDKSAIESCIYRFVVLQLLQMNQGSYIERKISEYVLRVAGMFPVVTLCGPRQSGKTTLARHLFPDYDYVSLENPHELQSFRADPLLFLSQHKAPCIFDEVQNAPELLSYLQGIIDERNEPGMYVLTGSRQMELQGTVTQSLAGRSAMVDLLPLSWDELKAAGISQTRDEALYNGGLPRVHAGKAAAEIVYANYLRTYVERDVRQLLNIRNLLLFDTFIRLLAARVGQEVNYASLAGDVGVSASTIKEWVSLLEASYVIVRIPPYHNNYGKRLTKSPKIYFTDTGLVASLLGIREISQLSREPLIGNIFENFIVTEILKARLNAGLSPSMYFFRDAYGFEIDLIIDSHRQPKPVEIKSAYTFNPSMCKNLEKFAKLVPDTQSPALVFAGDSVGAFKDIEVLNFTQLSSLALS